MITDLLRARLARFAKQQPREERHRLMNRILEFQIGPFAWLADIPCSLLFGRNLKMLATIYMTDKWNSHWYVQHYEELFRPYRRKKMTVLEIGVGGEEDPRKGGNSLRMWRSYFPNARIYGVDIFDKSPHNGTRIKTLRGSQADPAFLDSMVQEVGKVDIVIDDGSHRNDHVLFTFQHLFPHLAEHGFYVIEDTQTSYWEALGGNPVDRNDLSTTMGYFKSLTDGLNWQEFGADYKPTHLDMNIQSIAFYHELIVIRKGSIQEGHCPPK